MARIRSVHPSLFTDEAFMSASPLARLLTIGLWTEAWDDGAFEWKPVVIKARIFPADICDVVKLLQELVDLNVICRVERDGKSYGLIRNFRRFQKPKKPNHSGITKASDSKYLGPEYEKNRASSEPVPNQFRTSGEIPSLMEDGGGKGNKNIYATNGREALGDLEGQLREAANAEQNPAPSLMDLSPVRRCLSAGASLDMDVLPTIRAITARKHRWQSWRYAEQAIMDAKAAREAAPLNGVAPMARGQPPTKPPSRNRQLLDALDQMTGVSAHADPDAIAAPRRLA